MGVGLAVVALSVALLLSRETRNQPGNLHRSRIRASYLNPIRGPICLSLRRTDSRASTPGRLALPLFAHCGSARVAGVAPRFSPEHAPPCDPETAPFRAETGASPPWAEKCPSDAMVPETVGRERTSSPGWLAYQ